MDPAKQPSITYYLIGGLRGQATLGGDVGKQAVTDATTDEVIQILPNVEANIKRELGELNAAQAQAMIEEIWPLGYKSQKA